MPFPRGTELEGLSRELDEAWLDTALLREKLKWLLDELHQYEDIKSNGQANQAMQIFTDFARKFP